MQLDLDAERHHADDCRWAAGAQHAEGLLGGILRAERLEGIMHAALGQLAHRLDRVEIAGVDRVGGAELAREVKLRGHAVDRDDALGAGERRAIDRREADAAAAEDRERGGGVERGGVGDRDTTKQHAAATMTEARARYERLRPYTDPARER